MDSPELVIKTEPSPTLRSLSRVCGGDVDPDLRSFHGPGESPDISGLGRGVISPIAEMMGLGTRLLVPLVVPKLCANAALRLGVLDTARRLLVEVFR